MNISRLLFLLTILLGTLSEAAEVAPSAPARRRARGFPRICNEITSRVETGRASVYDDKFVGRPMACGGRFSQLKPTASIKLLPAPKGQRRRMLLPCGTIVRVTRTDKKAADGSPLSVDVTVTDNGPLTPSRVIDLPEAVAEQLHYSDGDVPVKLEVCR